MTHVDSYDLAIIVTGALVAGSCGFIGSFLILRGMALLGDAISHSVLLGIVLAFLITGDTSIVPMFVGALIFGLLTAVMVQALNRGGVEGDAATGVTFTAFFALGVVLLTAFAGRVHLDLDHVLYGEIAYVPWDLLYLGDVAVGPKALWTMGIVFLIDLLVVGAFSKEFKICSFDPGMAASLGINVALFHYLMTALVSLTTVAAFESVGAILAVAMLIVPGATAYLLTDSLGRMLGLSVAVGSLSAAGGYLLATWLDSSISGAMAATAGALFLLAFLFSPTHGVISRALARRRVGHRGESMLQ
mgnify:CR=1 FL=1